MKLWKWWKKDDEEQMADILRILNLLKKQALIISDTAEIISDLDKRIAVLEKRESKGRIQ